MTASDRTIVVGAGIVGASIAYHLAKRGAEVLVVDCIGPAAGATGKSFAWVNAHHIESETYHRLRYQSLTEYHRLEREMDGGLGVQWCGALAFDVAGDAFDRRLARFQDLGYPAEIVAHNRFRELEPSYSHPPDRALYLALEAAIDPVGASNALIEAAVRQGARTQFGSHVRAIRSKTDRVVGIETDHGGMAAERVVVAAGVGADTLLATASVFLPMGNRPGIMLHSKPLLPTLNHVIWGDRIHLKQQADGRLVIGEIFSEKTDDLDPEAIAEQMLVDAKRHLPDADIEIESTTIGLRPIPKDGMPVVGPIGVPDGLYIAVMHSGVTLAPIIGRLVAEEMLDGVRFESLTPYRLNRFEDVPDDAA